MRTPTTIRPVLLAAALACGAAGIAQAQTARFSASANSIGFDGARDDDANVGTTAAGAVAGTLLENANAPPNGNTRGGISQVQVSVGPTWLIVDTQAQLQAVAAQGQGSYGGGMNAWGRASASVPFRIDAAGLAGQPGRMEVPLLVSGTDMVTAGLSGGFPGSLLNSAQSLLGVSGTVSSLTPGCLSGFQQCHTLTQDGRLVETGAPLTSLLVSFPFVFGQWTSFDIQLEASAASSGTASSPTTATPGAAVVAGQAASRYELQWGGIQSVLTGGGASVSGWTVSSIPGVNLAPVPEPGSAGLLAAGALVLGWLGRRRLGACQPTAEHAPAAH